MQWGLLQRFAARGIKFAAGLADGGSGGGSSSGSSAVAGSGVSGSGGAGREAGVRAGDRGAQMPA